MDLYSQRDPCWRDIEIGKSGRKMAQIGCVVTSLAMLSSYFLPQRNPREMAMLLKFLDDGRVVWDSVDFENWEFYRRAWGREDVEIREHVRNPNLAVLLEVAQRTHWVVATGSKPLSGLFKIADPLDGTRDDMSKYQDNITGAAYFKRK